MAREPTPQSTGGPGSGTITTRGRIRARRGRIRARLDRLMRHPVTDATVMTLIVVSVALLMVEIEGWAPGQWHDRVVLAGHLITGCFVVELSLRWMVAPSTCRFWRDYWLDVLAVLPFFRPLRLLRVLRLLRLYRLGVMAQRFLKRETDFERELRADIHHYRGDFATQVWLAPDLYRLLGNLLDDGRVHAEARAIILPALAYFIAPFQVLHRADHGPEGYLDQVYVVLEAIRRLKQTELPEWLIEDHWEGEGEVCRICQTDLPILAERLGEDGVAAVHRYLAWEVPEIRAAA